jgi:hypothetical protein
LRKVKSSSVTGFLYLLVPLQLSEFVSKGGAAMDREFRKRGVQLGAE